MDIANFIPTDCQAILLLASLSLLFITIAGCIRTQWFTLDVSSWIQRLALGFLGVVTLSISLVWNKVSIHSLERVLLEGDGSYEWCWAGQNWHSRVVFIKSGSNGDKIIPNIEGYKIHKTQPEGGRPQQHIVQGPLVLRSLSGSRGTVRVTENEIILENVVVEKYGFNTIQTPEGDLVEGLEASSEPKKVTLSGSLKPVPAFAGRVIYRGIDEEGPGIPGDMILVRYKSGLGF